VTHDLVIRGGTVVDGTGLAGYRADVAIDGERITTIGRVTARGRVEVDAEGHVVTPGFIDGHTHLDAQVFWDQLGSCVCWHGVTTAVMGHCGFTLAPSSAADRALVVRNLERAEDISGAAMAAGIDWSWTTFAEYLDAVDRQPKGINYAANLGHSALRTYAMGERAFTEAASDDDLGAMVAELRAAICAGAYGFTTSRTIHHQTSDDRPVASRLASWDEVRVLVGEMGALGAGIFQITQDPPLPDERAAYDERYVRLAVESGAPIVMGAIGATIPATLQLLDRIAAAGGVATGITHCRGIGTLTSFRTRMPFDTLAEWAPIRARPEAEQRRAFADPAVRERLVHDAHHGAYGNAVGAEARRPEFDRMRVLDSPLPPNPSVAELASARGVDPVEVLLDLAIERFDQLFMQTMAPFDAELVGMAMRHPRTVTGFSDSGAHVSQMSDCSLPTHLLGHWVRNTGTFSLEEGVRMLTLEPARGWGFHDRGLVREGMVADLNVFDPATITPDLPVVANDLPANEPRLVQTATGFRATIVAGEVVHHDGVHTGALPGRLIRGPLAHRPR
jgi:N-acyl-D-aspartate/D-glutamate deacylase